jgi:hypothetical protein
MHGAMQQVMKAVPPDQQQGSALNQEDVADQAAQAAQCLSALEATPG